MHLRRTPVSLLIASLFAIGMAMPQRVLAQTATGATADTAGCTSANLLAGKMPTSRLGLRGDPALATDGAVGPEGALWDAPVAVVLNSGTDALLYDLGEPRTISAVYLQADANDTYKLIGSLDNTTGSYGSLGEFANVVERGPGLRGRVLRFEPTRVRYLRIGDGAGDGFFSIAEVAAYCTAPQPFPPQLRVTAAQLAPGNAIKREPDRLEQQSRERAAGWSLAAVLLLALGAFPAFTGLRRGLAARRERTSATSPTPSSGGTAPALRGGAMTLHAPLLLMFVASGCAALIYEVVWFHLLRLVIGASALSVGIVLASFMGGMFLGSLLFPRLITPERNPLRVYAWLELGIGVFGLAMPLLLPGVRFVYTALFGYGALGIALRGVVASVLLLPPTALMGATLPAVARRYPAGRRGGAGLAALYAANTFGAVLGCLLSGFYLLAQFDVWVTTFVAAALNLAIFVYARTLAGRAAAEQAANASAAPRTAALAGGASWVYLAAGFSGLTALGAQVVWTRLLTIVFGATVYAFAIILAVFLGGLGIGGALAATLLRRGKSPLFLLWLCQLALVPALWWSGVLLADVLPYSSPAGATPVRALHALHVLRAFDVILPAAALWGMSFPLALAAAARAHADTGRSSAYVYAANTLGAIAGALGISFYAIPEHGTQWAEQALVACAACSAALLALAWRRTTPATTGGAASALARALPPAWVLALGALAAAALPGVSTVFLAHGRHIWWVDPRDQYPYVSEGAASTVAVHIAPDGYRNFHVSGRVEASNNPSDLRLERLLGHLSVLAHPKPRSILVVGLGGGVTAGALTLHTDVRRIVICEIEPRVTGAAAQFAEENYNVLKDDRVQLIFDDARHFLATTDEKFDVITSDPIHPWVRGNSVLFSREYYAIVKSKLNPGGIATQWVPLYDTSEEAIQIQMRTFTDAFPNGTVWNSSLTNKGYDVALLGSVDPIELDVAKIQQRIVERPSIARSLSQVKLDSAIDLLATYGASASDMRGFVAHAQVNRDFSLKLEYISGLALNEQNADPIYAHMTAAHTFPDKLFKGPPEILAELRRRILTGH